MSDFYQKVAYIGLRNPDGSYMMNIPLYVKVKEVNANGVTSMQESLIHEVSEIMMKHYDRQLSEFIANKKQMEVKNEKV